MQRIAILGSTGSIGHSALEVIRRFPDRFQVIGLSTNANVEILAKQIREFHPEFVCVRDIAASKKIRAIIKSPTKLLVGDQGLVALVKNSQVEKILLAISGSCALTPLLKAVESGKQIALANKEALVMAGSIIMRRAEKKKIKVIPIDSEQSAIWQCLEGESKSGLETIYLTASGGPLREMRKKDLKDISLQAVLKHPRWKMGKKITVDSATLMNKGLEVLEAMFLFGVPSEKIKIVIHPEAIVHSMVEFQDGVVLAQLSATDMRIPIQYALSYPQRFSNTLPRLDFYQLKELHFQAPDFKRFPCLRLAYRAARGLGTLPAVLNAANEVSVDEFLQGKIKFISIPKIIEKVLDRHRNIVNPDLEDIIVADTWARRESCKVIAGLNVR